MLATAVSWPGYSFWEIIAQKNLAPDLELEVIVLNDPVTGYGMLAAGQMRDEHLGVREVR